MLLRSSVFHQPLSFWILRHHQWKKSTRLSIKENHLLLFLTVRLWKRRLHANGKELGRYTLKEVYRYSCNNALNIKASNTYHYVHPTRFCCGQWYFSHFSRYFHQMKPPAIDTIHSNVWRPSSTLRRSAESREDSARSLVESLSKRRSQVCNDSDETCLRLAATSLECGAGATLPTHCPVSLSESAHPVGIWDAAGDVSLQEKPTHSEIMKPKPQQHQELRSLSSFIENEIQMKSDSNCTESSPNKKALGKKANSDDSLSSRSPIPRHPEHKARPLI